MRINKQHLRTLYRPADWVGIETGVPQGCLLSPCLFNLYSEHIMRNAGLDELQTGIKIGRRNINNLNIQMISLYWQSEKELKNLLTRVEEESEKSWFKTKY